MPRKGTLAPGVKLVATLPDGHARCQWVKKPKEGQEWGEQCQKRPVEGRPFCRSHGGTSGRKPVHGKRSKYGPVPQGLLKRFEEAQRDPDLLNLSRQIALLDAKIWAIAEKASARKDFTKPETHELLKVISAHQALVSQEVSRRVSLGTMVDVRDVLLLIGYLYDSVVKNVKDPDARRRIASDLRKLTVGLGENILPESAAEPALQELQAPQAEQVSTLTIENVAAQG